MDNYLESSQLFQQLPFSFILMRTNYLICFQQLEQNFRFGSKLPDMQHFRSEQIDLNIFKAITAASCVDIIVNKCINKYN